jgi:hypothetical protein
MNRHAMPAQASWLHLLAILALSIAYEALFLGYSNGEFFDEGWPLNAAMQLHAGRALYTEIFFTFPPGHLWPAWIAYALDPPGVELARAFYALFNVALCVSLYFLGLRIMPARFALWGALAVAVAAPHSHMGHLLFGYRYLVFSVLALLALGRGLTKDDRSWLFVAGIWTGIALLFRLTPAFAVSCGVAAALVACRIPWSLRLKHAVAFGCGVLLVTVPLLLWLSQSSGLGIFWQEVIVRVMGLQGLQSMPVPSIVLPEFTNRQAVHLWFVGLQYWGYTALYAAYLLSFAVGLWRLRTDPNRAQSVVLQPLVVAIVVWGAVFFLRTLGRSDDHHLNSALPPAVLLLAYTASGLFARFWRNRDTQPSTRQISEIGALAGLLVAWLFIQGLDRNFDVWDRGLVPMRAGIASQDLKPTVEAIELERLLGSIQSRSRPGDTLLDLSASPLLYVLADRQSVGGFDIFMPGTFTSSQEEVAFVQRLEASPPALIIWPGWAFDSRRDRAVQRTAPLVSRWALDHYAPIDAQSQSNRFVLLAPKETAPAEPTTP